DLAGDLLELDDHELGRLEWSEADDDVDDAEIDVVLRGGLLVTLHEVRVSWRAPLERPLAEEIVHEGAHVEPDLSPERLIVRLEDHPLCSPEQAFLDVQSQSPNRDVLVLIRQLVRATESPRSPHHAPVHRKRAEAVDPSWIQQAILLIVQLGVE